MDDLRAADHDADHPVPFLVFAQMGQTAIESIMRLRIPGIGHDQIQPGFHLLVGRLAAGLGTNIGQFHQDFLQRGVQGNRNQAQLAAYQARGAVRDLRHQQEVRRPRLAGTQHALDQKGQVRIVGLIAEKNERPLVIQAGDKGRCAGGANLRRDLGRGQAQRSGHVGATEDLQKEAAVAVRQRAGIGGKRGPAHDFGVIGQGGGPKRIERRGDQAAPGRMGQRPDGIGHLHTFSTHTRQHIAQHAVVKQLTHQRQGRGHTTLLQEIGKGDLVLLGHDPFQEALAKRSPAGKLGQLGTAGTGY